MRPRFLALLLLLAPLTAPAQTITLIFNLGILSNSAGTPIANGSLLQVIASPDSTFTAPTASLFTAGNDVLVYSGGFDSSSVGVSGGTNLTLADLSLTTYPIAGYNLAVRWFPTLTTANSTPGASTSYGQRSTNDDPSWVAPSSGGTSTLSFLTASAGNGAIADTVGRATLTTPAAIPEPSTYAAIVGALALGAAAWRRRQRRTLSR